MNYLSVENIFIINNHIKKYQIFPSFITKLETKLETIIFLIKFA
jgi:hypothetical protein